MSKERSITRNKEVLEDIQQALKRMDYNELPKNCKQGICEVTDAVNNILEEVTKQYNDVGCEESHAKLGEQQ